MKNLLSALFLILFCQHVFSVGASITHISPTSGDTVGGYSLLILTDTALISPSVTVGGQNCQINSSNSNSIACTVPSGVGTVDVLVTSDAFVMPSVTFKYNAPTITSVDPSTLNRAGGDSVQISGVNFGEIVGTVTINGNACTNITTYTDSMITCTAPAASTGSTSSITVTQAGGFEGNLTNVISYEACESGSFESNGICQECPEGTFQDLDGQTQCKPCLAGTYANTTGAKSCNLCEHGRFQNQIGQNVCFTCPQGKFQDELGQTKCKNCLAGSFSSEEEATSCTACPKGKFQDQIGRNSCNDCDPGHFQSLEGQASCQACSVGTFSSGPGAQNCESCVVGRFQNLSGQTSCMACQPGSFSNFPGAMNCTSCPAGSFQDQVGSIECLTCPDGTTQPASGQSECHGGNVCDALFGLSKSGFESGLVPVVQ